MLNERTDHFEGTRRKKKKSWGFCCCDFCCCCVHLNHDLCDSSRARSLNVSDDRYVFAVYLSGAFAFV